MFLVQRNQDVVVRSCIELVFTWLRGAGEIELKHRLLC